MRPKDLDGLTPRQFAEFKAELERREHTRQRAAAAQAATRPRPQTVEEFQAQHA